MLDFMLKDYGLHKLTVEDGRFYLTMFQVAELLDIHYSAVSHIVGRRKHIFGSVLKKPAPEEMGRLTNHKVSYLSEEQFYLVCMYVQNSKADTIRLAFANHIKEARVEGYIPGVNSKSFVKILKYSLRLIYKSLRKEVV